MRRIACASLLALVWLPLTAQGQTARDTTRLPIDPQVITGTLPNGLRYYIRENHKPEKRVELRLAVNAGSVLEDADQLGLAHFTEHMAFNGTRHFEKNELVAYMRSIGMRMGPEVNAYTGFDETVYMLTVPTDTAKFLAQGLQVMDDWAQGQTMDTTEIRKERGVILEEWRLGRGAYGRLRDRYIPVLFAGSLYGQRLPIGTSESIKGFAPDALRRFYRDWYRPDQMALVVVGDMDAKAMEATVRQRFGAIPAAKSPRARPLPAVPSVDSTRYLVATDREMPQSQVSIYFKLPADTVRTVADYRRRLVDGLWDRMLNQRLYELSMKADPPFVNAGSGRGLFVRSARVFNLGAAIREGGEERAVDALLTEAERARRFGFTAPELDRARASLLRSMEQQYAEREKTESARFASEYVSNFLEGSASPMMGITATYALTQKILPTVTLEEVNASGSVLGDPDRTVLAFGPEKAGVQQVTVPKLAAVMSGVAGKTLEPYREILADVPLVPSMPAAGAVVAERELKSAGARELRLANGVRLILKPTDFKADEIVLNGLSFGGSSLVNDRLAPLASSIPSIVSSGGAGTFSAIDLGKKLAGKAASAYVGLGETTESAGGYASPRDLETMFQLLYLRMSAPRADTVAFQAMRQRMRAAFENRGLDPQAVFSDSLNAVLSQHSVRARPLTAAMADSIQLDELMRIYRDRFGDAGDFVFALVGNFNVDSVRPLAVKYLGALPSAAKHELWRNVAPQPPAGVARVVVRKGIEQKSSVALVFTGPITYDYEHQQGLRSLADYLNIRLMDLVREELGGTYGVGASAGSTRDPQPRYTLRISFGCSPDRVDELTTKIFQDLERLRTVGPDSGDVAKVRRQQLRELEINQKENRMWSGRLVFQALYEPDFPSIDREKASVDRLTAPFLRDQARQYLNAGRYVQGVLLPEKAADDLKAAPARK